MTIANRLVATALAAVTAVAMTTSTASARTDNFYYHVVFYSDPEMTIPIGDYSQTCQNNTTILTPPYSGPTSPYVGYEVLGVCPGLGDW